MQTSHHVTCVDEVCKVERFRVVDDKKDLGFDAQLGVHACIAATGAETLARRHVARRVDPVHFNRVAWLDGLEGVIARWLREFCFGEGGCLIALPAAVLTITGGAVWSRSTC